MFETQKAYALFADYYQAVGEARGHFQMQVAFVQQIINGHEGRARILDAACATGNVIHTLKERSPELEVYGSDFCQDLLEIAFNNFPSLSERLLAASWDSLSNTFTGYKFDYVFILGNSIAHCDSKSSFKRTLREVSKILEKGGTFIFDIRPWQKNIEKGLFNEPNKSQSIEINMGSNSFHYTTDYEHFNNRHILNHTINRRNQGPIHIHLSFLDISEVEIVDLLTENSFCDVGISKDFDYYPFIVFRAVKCK